MCILAKQMFYLFVFVEMYDEQWEIMWSAQQTRGKTLDNSSGNNSENRRIHCAKLTKSGRDKECLKSIPASSNCSKSTQTIYHIGVYSNTRSWNPHDNRRTVYVSPRIFHTACDRCRIENDNSNINNWNTIKTYSKHPIQFLYVYVWHSFTLHYASISTDNVKKVSINFLKCNWNDCKCE